MFVQTVLSAVALSTLAALANAQAIINTPAALVQCQPVRLAWSATKGPYYITALPGGQPSGAPLANIGTFDDTSATWTVNIPAGTAVSLSIVDGSGVPNYSAQVTVAAGSTTCMTNAAAAAAPAAGASAPPAAAAAAPPAAATSRKGRTKTLPGETPAVAPAAAAVAATGSVAPAALAPAAAAAAAATTTLASVAPIATKPMSVVTVSSTLAAAQATTSTVKNAGSRGMVANSAATVFVGLVAVLALAA